MQLSNCEPVFVREPINVVAQRPGVIYVANESRFTHSAFSEELTDLAAGWSDAEGIKSILDFVAPEVPASRRFEYAGGSDAASVPADADDVRAIGADFKRVDMPTPHEFGATLNKGLTIRIDRQASLGILDIERVYTLFLIARLYRNDFKRAVALLDSAATNTNKTWSSGSPDPDAEIMDVLIAAEADSGLAPNRLLFGQAAYRLRAKAMRASDVAGVAATAGLSPTDLAPVLGVDAIRTSGHRYQGQPATKDRIVGSAVYGFFGHDTPTLADASNLKRFVTPFADGRLIRVHRNVINANFMDLSVEHYSNVVLNSDVGIQKITVS